MYEFNDRTAPQDLFGALSFPLGAYHGSDIQYVMDSPDGPAQLSSDSQQLANTIQSYWAQFARTGNPNGGTLPAWPLYADPWGIGGPNIFMSLDAPTPHPISSGDYLTRHGCGINGPPYRD